MPGVGGRRNHAPAQFPPRIGWALAVSVALHALAVVAIRAGPPSLASGASTPIEARIALPDPRGEPGRQAEEAGSSPPAGIDEPEVSDVRATEMKAPPPARASRAEPAVPARQAHAARALPLESDSTYHLIASLDRPPVPLSAPDACYPHGARGEVAYELLIDETGLVNQATIDTVEPAGLFTAAAVELCSAIRFAPAIKDGRAVRSRVRLVVGRS